MILDLLAQNNLISADDANRAKAMPLGLINGSGATSNYYPAFLDFVRRTLHRDYKDADLTEAGLTIFTHALDPRIQKRAEIALASELAHTGQDIQTQRSDTGRRSRCRLITQ